MLSSLLAHFKLERLIFLEKKLYPCIITEKMISEAIELVRPIIEKFGSKIWIIATDPQKQFGEFDFEESILIEQEIGDSTEKRRENAKGKAKFSWENHLSSKMAAIFPELLTEGDCVWGGSWVIELKPGKYFVVAISGFSEAKDELVSRFVAEAVIMLISERIVELKDSDEAAIIR